MSIRGQIREVIAKAAGGLTMAQIAEKTGAPKFLGTALYQMTKEGQLNKSGDGVSASYTLIDRPVRGAGNTKPAKGNKAAKPRSNAGGGAARPSPNESASAFLPAVTSIDGETRVVLINGNSHQLLSVQETNHLADVVLMSFEKE